MRILWPKIHRRGNGTSSPRRRKSRQLESQQSVSRTRVLSRLHPYVQGWKTLDCRELDAGKLARPDLTERCGG